MLSEDQKTKPSTNFKLAELLPDIRAGVDSNISDSFDDDTLMLYATHYHEERSTAQKCIGMVVKHAQDRANRRPGSGHADEKALAHSDDPYGRDADKARFTSIAEEHKAARAAAAARRQG